jgi:hypothetical protein
VPKQAIEGRLVDVQTKPHGVPGHETYLLLGLQTIDGTTWFVASRQMLLRLAAEAQKAADSLRD